ncbi:ATP synthase subunit C lysine N-methyltransferase isoform X3 [Myripristis murdjan]|uniref:ATP synthase subunit C lysine N-methyltransferase isoform X3 n=1 Tax=Myripristis murdjan TaxID=586833 RepID=UPI001175EF13|nr:ATP synthase subunit C lysine N-methyltransferase-like isoform X3 [Myripristis murdjan]
MEPLCHARLPQNPLQPKVLHANKKCGNLRKCTRWTRKHHYQEQMISSWVPYLPSSKDQTLNIMRLLEGRTGHLADLGSGDGRLVFAASSAGFQCTGFEINSLLVAYSRSKALWIGVPPSQATFVKKDFWKTDLSIYNNVTAFLAPGVMEVLGDKLLKELPDDARVIVCRFPIPHWPHHSSVGSGLDQSWAYDIGTVRSRLGTIQSRD